MVEDIRLLGAQALGRGDHRSAVALLARALQERPRDPACHVLLGLALLADGEAEAARASLNIACLLAPDDAHAHAMHGRALAVLGRTDEALACFDRSLTFAADSAETHHERAGLLLASGRPEAALTGFERVAALRPDDPVAAANLGAALQATGRAEAAETILSTALARAPDRPETLSNRGLARAALGRLDPALEDLRRARALAPDDAAIARHLALVHYERDERAEARSLLETILRRDPCDSAARFNLGILDLAEGHLAQGWAGFAHRSGVERHLPLLDGSPVVLKAEQGLGDTLQFLRYVKLAAARSPVMLSLPDVLRRAAAGLGVPLIGARDPRAIPLGDLPRLFSPTLSAIPPPFAAAYDRRAAERWSRLRRPGERQVGLVWSGSPAYRQDRRRSIEPALLRPLLDVPGVRFVSLGRAEAPPGTLDPGTTQDFAETAALVSVLDLVISVDTAIVHLAAGLGCPTWLLDRAGGDWRWLRGREDSPWYPSVRIFRQDRPDPPEQAWPPVIGRVRDALLALS